MKIHEIEIKVKVEPKAKALWKEFERTGSIKTYLLFIKQSQNRKEKLPALLPLYW